MIVIVIVAVHDLVVVRIVLLAAMKTIEFVVNLTV